MDYLGNTQLMVADKTAFLCSRSYPASIVLKAYDWALKQREQGNCVISGFQSTIEKDVFNILLQGQQPLIMVLARGMFKRWSPNILGQIDSGRLLVISPFNSEVIRPTAETCLVRNQYICKIADRILVAHLSSNGLLANSIANLKAPKEITVLSRSD